MSMTDELIKKLRTVSPHPGSAEFPAYPASLCHQAADELEYLAGTVDAWRKEYADRCKHIDEQRALIDKQAAEIERLSSGYRVFRDGAVWCAVGPRFQNLMESKAAFGETPLVALACLKAREADHA